MPDIVTFAITIHFLVETLWCDYCQEGYRSSGCQVNQCPISYDRCAKIDYDYRVKKTGKLFKSWQKECRPKFFCDDDKDEIHKKFLCDYMKQQHSTRVNHTYEISNCRIRCSRSNDLPGIASYLSASILQIGVLLSGAIWYMIHE